MSAGNPGQGRLTPELIDFSAVAPTRYSAVHILSVVRSVVTSRTSDCIEAVAIRRLKAGAVQVSQVSQPTHGILLVLGCDTGGQGIPPEPMRPAHECLELSSVAGKPWNSMGTAPLVKKNCQNILDERLFLPTILEQKVWEGGKRPKLKNRQQSVMFGW